ncbi:MAG: nitroreductase family protein [Methanobacteriota archaeon]
MQDNEVIRTLMSRKSIRKYKQEAPPKDVVEAIVRAGMRAPFAAQACSVVLLRDRKRNAFGAPLMFVVCADVHRVELFMRERGWKVKTNDLTMLLFAMQDACYMAENMVIAAESLGLGSCYIGHAMMIAKTLKKNLKLPESVFPFVMLAMGYPAEDPPVRPRYPLGYVLFEGEYPKLTRAEVRRAMKTMDEYYPRVGYYRKLKAKIPIHDKKRKDAFTYDDYTWTEHISRKWGQWHPDVDGQLEQLRACGFELDPGRKNGRKRKAER